MADEVTDARERQLQAIGDVIEHWIKSVAGERDLEGLATIADTHVMLGYENAPPHWPSIGQLTRWLMVLRDQPAMRAADNKDAGDGLRDAVVKAYIQGAHDVHDNWQGDRDPDFTEAALDYACEALASPRADQSNGGE